MSRATGPQLSATTKDLTGEAVAARQQRPLSKSTRRAWIGLALGAGLGLFLVGGLKRPALVASRRPEPAPSAPVVIVPPPSAESTTPTEAVHREPAAPPPASNRPKPKGRTARGLGNPRRVQEATRELSAESTAAPPIRAVSPAEAPPVPDPILASPPPPPPIGARPETPAPPHKPSGFTKL